MQLLLKVEPEQLAEAVAQAEARPLAMASLAGLQQQAGPI